MRKKLVAILSLSLATPMFLSAHNNNYDQTTIVNSVVEESQSIEWVTSYDEALKLSKEKNKPIMAEFYAEWCPACNALDSITFRNEEVVNLSRSFINLKIDTDKKENIGVSQKYGLEFLPTIVFINTEGGSLEKQVGYAKPKKMAQLMDNVLKEYYGK
ncbi:thioredoxin family protein [Candidatus Woesearchaeota archaeon]|nr:thioredoxin family protein [Candidatus Woesearchaeota archaeon]